MLEATHTSQKTPKETLQNPKIKPPHPFNLVISVLICCLQAERDIINPRFYRHSLSLLSFYSIFPVSPGNQSTYPCAHGRKQPFHVFCSFLRIPTILLLGHHHSGNVSKLVPAYRAISAALGAHPWTLSLSLSHTHTCTHTLNVRASPTPAGKLLCVCVCS